ncbi:MAG: polysaccharide pyruvyl transferase family protein [Coleofasciculus sp. S288]|nr:polysaccharide pyruvyl transferase family protein [Coleofasciculus sp. S288]
MNILLMGYYGQSNIGDDLFVKQLTTYFSTKDVVKNVFVICQDNYYEKVSDKVSFFSTSNLSKLKRAWLILRSDCIAWGGGTLNFSGKPKNYLRLQALSKVMGKRFCFLGVGIESIKSDSDKGIAQVFENADLLYVRDNYSYELASQTFKTSQSCCLGGDLAFLNLSLYDRFLKRDKSSNQLHNISFSGKHWWGDGRAEFYAKQLIPVIEQYNSVIHLLPAHVGDKRNDNKFHELLKKYLPENHCQLHSWKHPEEFIEILSQMDFHIGNRLHSLILADILGVPNIGIGEASSKIGNYVTKTGILTTERVAAFMEPLPLERIEKISQSYERPDEFILNESQTARECLEIIFRT